MSQWPLRHLQPVSHIHWNMDQSNKNWCHVPHTRLRYSERTTRMSTINWKRQQEEHHMRPLSSHSRGQNKAGRHGWQSLGSMLEDKWAAEIKRQEQLLNTCMWKGQSNFSLEKFIAQHHNAFFAMQACAEHIQYQLPNGHSRVGFCWTQSKPVTPASRQQWLASGPMTDLMGCEMTSSSQRHTFYHMTR